MNKTELEWGETPFDHMTNEELLFNAKRMYSALISLYSVARLSKGPSDNSAFWGKDGSGGIALEKGKQALGTIHEQYSNEDVYCSYFRYAVDLLFESNEYCIGSRWAVCPKCGIMLGAGRNGKEQIGKACSSTVMATGCDGVLRKIEWSDLQVKPSEEDKG